MASELEVVEELRFVRDYLSSYFINNAEKQSAAPEDVAFFPCDNKLGGRLVTDASALMAVQTYGSSELLPRPAID